jgi:hypothetical protein
MKTLILMAMLAGFQVVNAQVVAPASNFLGYTDAEIAASQQSINPIRTAYGIEQFVEENGSFQNALRSYFLVKSQSERTSFSVQSFLRTQEGIWWESTAAKRKTIYLLKFRVSNGSFSSQDCQIKFSRSETQLGSSRVVPVLSSLVCVANSTSPF